MYVAFSTSKGLLPFPTPTATHSLHQRTGAGIQAPYSLPTPAASHCVSVSLPVCLSPHGLLVLRSRRLHHSGATDKVFPPSNHGRGKRARNMCYYAQEDMQEEWYSKVAS